MEETRENEREGGREDGPKFNLRHRPTTDTENEPAASGRPREGERGVIYPAFSQLGFLAVYRATSTACSACSFEENFRFRWLRGGSRNHAAFRRLIRSSGKPNLCQSRVSLSLFSLSAKGRGDEDIMLPRLRPRLSPVNEEWADWIRIRIGRGKTGKRTNERTSEERWNGSERAKAAACTVHREGPAAAIAAVKIVHWPQVTSPRHTASGTNRLECMTSDMARKFRDKPLKLKLKRNSYFNVNKRLSSTRWTIL